MKILVYGLSCNLGGVESFLINYCKAIHDYAPIFEFDFLVLDEVPAYVNDLEDVGFGFVVAPNPTRHPLAYRRALKAIIDGGGYDCLWANQCTMTDVSVLRMAVGHIPVRIIHSHNSQNMGGIHNRILHSINRHRIHSLANRFFACSDEAGRFMFGKACLSSEKYAVIKNGIDVERFRFRPEERQRLRRERGWDDDPIIVTVGRMHAQKNPMKVLSVFRAMHSMNPKAKLVYIGEGDMESEIRRYVKESSMEDSVSFVGSVSNPEVYLWAADLFLFPSLFEGFSIALVEAQATGLPCLVSDAIQSESLLVPWTRRMPLGSGDDEWMNAAFALMGESVDRASAARLIRDAGYAIKENAISLAATLVGTSDGLL